MTPRQQKLARWALGLNFGPEPYRNDYAARPGGHIQAEWLAMVAAGDAEMVPHPSARYARFKLTNAGMAKVWTP
jgi:hypothetical protein